MAQVEQVDIHARFVNRARSARRRIHCHSDTIDASVEVGAKPRGDGHRPYRLGRSTRLGRSCEELRRPSSVYDQSSFFKIPVFQQ